MGEWVPKASGLPDSFKENCLNIGDCSMEIQVAILQFSSVFLGLAPSTVEANSSSSRASLG